MTSSIWLEHVSYIGIFGPAFPVNTSCGKSILVPVQVIAGIVEGVEAEGGNRAILGCICEDPECLIALIDNVGMPHQEYRDKINAPFRDKIKNLYVVEHEGKVEEEGKE